MPTKQLSLIPDDAPPPAPQHFDVLFSLLKQVTSIGVVSAYLKAKGLVHSAGSWDDLREKRLLPALRKHEITMVDLLALLSEAEEYGRSHTFLYSCPQELARGLIQETKVHGIANDIGLKSAIGAGRVLDQPSKPTIACVRFDEDPRGRCLVLKVVEKRLEHHFLGETLHGNRLRREWEVVEMRAVNVVRLFSFGLLEIRIASHHSSTKYTADIRRMWKMIEPFVPAAVFRQYSLANAKHELWDQKSAMRNRIRFSNSTLRNGVGTTLSAASGAEEGDLFTDKAATASVDAFWAGGEVYCETSNIYWQPLEGGLPSREIHVLLPESRNEFAIPANCSKADYEYVLDQLRSLSG